MGFDSAQATRTSYGFKSHDVTAHGLVKPVSWLRTGATVGYLHPSIGAGRDTNFPSIEALFTDVDAPGLAEQPDFLHTTVFADVDYRDQRGNPRSGGFYHLSYGIWNDRSFDQYDFRRFDVNVRQYVPLVASKAQVVSGHFGVSYVNNATGARVPFYFLPYVGGVDTIRSFREFRFKEENAMWMSAEYDWAPIKWVSLAAFVDAGRVARDWDDLDFGGMKKGYGFGVRVHSTKQTFARFDIATGGGEGWQTFLKLGAGF
jgi:outer membrane protein assembly factor BamA